MPARDAPVSPVTVGEIDMMARVIVATTHIS